MATGNSICPGCGKKINPQDKKFMVATDVPYSNIYWHKSCWEEYKSKGNLERVRRERGELE